MLRSLGRGAVKLKHPPVKEDVVKQLKPFPTPEGELVDTSYASEACEVALTTFLTLK